MADEERMTEALFAEAVMSKMKAMDEDDQSEETDAPEEPVEEPGDTAEPEAAKDRPRDPETGRFLPQEPVQEELPFEGGTEPTEIVSSVEEDTTGQQVLELDPNHPFFTKYGGDPEAALKALEESQSMIGRQGQELGELRRLQERQDLLEQQLKQQQEVQQPESNNIDWGALIEHDPAQAAQMAYQYADAGALQAAVDAWGEEDPFQAAMFAQRLAQEHLQYELQQRFESQQASLGPQSLPEDVQVEIRAVKDSHDDFDQYIPAMTKLSQELPLLAQTLQQGDAKTRAMALEDLYRIAKSQDIPDTSDARRTIALRVKSETDQAKADAAVVAASSSAPSAVSGTDLFKQRFREATGLTDVDVE